MVFRRPHPARRRNQGAGRAGVARLRRVCVAVAVAALAGLIPETPARAGAAVTRSQAHILSGDLRPDTEGPVTLVLTQAAKKPGAVSLWAIGKLVTRGGAAVDTDPSRPGMIRVPDGGRYRVHLTAASGPDGRRLPPTLIRARSGKITAESEDAALTIDLPADDQAHEIYVGGVFPVPKGAPKGTYTVTLRVDRLDGP